MSLINEKFNQGGTLETEYLILQSTVRPLQSVATARKRATKQVDSYLSIFRVIQFGASNFEISSFPAAEG